MPDPVATTKLAMEQRIFGVAALVPIFGAPHRVHEVLNRKGPFTLRMIWQLHKQLGVPAESLIRPPEEKVAAQAVEVVT